MGNCCSTPKEPKKQTDNDPTCRLPGATITNLNLPVDERIRLRKERRERRRHEVGFYSVDSQGLTLPNSNAVPPTIINLDLTQAQPLPGDFEEGQHQIHLTSEDKHGKDDESDNNCEEDSKLHQRGETESTIVEEPSPCTSPKNSRNTPEPGKRASVTSPTSQSQYLPQFLGGRALGSVTGSFVVEASLRSPPRVTTVSGTASFSTIHTPPNTVESIPSELSDWTLNSTESIHQGHSSE